MKNTLLVLFFAALQIATITAQSPTPAPKQNQSILIFGGVAHLGNGQRIENAVIAFEQGKITMVADATTVRIDRNSYGKIYDAAGKHIYPGLIAPNARLGLVEIESVRATLDFAEIGEYNANARSLVAYNTDSDIIPTVRSNGVLMAQIVPSGGIISGSSSVVHLDAWNYEDAVVAADLAMHLFWPNITNRNFWEPDATKNEKYDQQVDALHRIFSEAKSYAKSDKNASTNPRFAAMQGIFEGKQKLFIHTSNARTMRESILFAEKFGCQPVIVGGNDAYLLADFFREHQVPVVLGETQRLPDREDEAIAQSFSTAGILEKAGVLFAFSSDGAWQQRNLPFQAGQAVGHGLAQETAVQALTLNTAKILGIDKNCGSLEVGKDATLFISEGDILDMRSALVLAAFIQGREINLDNKHRQLDRRYREKYKQN